VAVVGLAQAVQAVLAAVVMAAATHRLEVQRVQSTWAAVVVAVDQIVAAVQVQAVLVVQALRSCKSKHRCTQVLQLAHLLLRLQVHLQL
jgi:hypothetical protein